MHDLGLDLMGALHGEKAFIGPEHVVVDITNRCNTNCIACWTYSPLLRDKAAPVSWKRQEIPGDAAHRLMDDLAVLGTRRVRFTGGGDPILHPQFYSLIRRIKSRGMRALVTTNMIKADTEKFAEAGIDEITASLWASNPTTYSRLHPNQGPATFSRITRVLEELRQTARPPVMTLANVINRMNFHEMEEMYEYAIDLGVHAVYFTLVDPVQGATEGLMLTDEERHFGLQAIERIQARQKSLGESAPLLDNVGEFTGRLSNQEATNGFYDAGRIDELPCTIGWNFCRILADGDVVPCCRAVMLPLGNIIERPFKEIWFALKYNEFREKALKLKKDDPYFEEVQCYRMCDNLMHNRQFADRLDGLGDPGRGALQTRLRGYLDAAKEPPPEPGTVAEKGSLPPPDRDGSEPPAREEGAA